MVTSKKKRPLSSEDKSKLTTVYGLLQWKGLNATAAALAKEAELVVPSNKPQSHSQEALWSRLSLQQEEPESDSDSSESDLDDESESGDSEANTIVQPKKLPNEIKKEESSDSSSTSSSSDSDSDSDDKKEGTSDSESSSSSSSDDDESESSDSESSINDVKAHRVGSNLKRKRPSPSSSSESTSSSDDSDSSESSTSDSSSSSDESSGSSADDEPPKKVQKTEKRTSAAQAPPSPALSKTLSPPAQRNVASPPAKSSSPNQIHPDRQKLHNGEPKRFSRIKTGVEVHPGVASNAYNAGESNYGAKAHKDLIVTRGDGFRKEKQKKKRGSYKGGVIDFEARSFKFID